MCDFTRKVGFVGLGNVGAKLAGSLLRNGVDLIVHDLNADFIEKVSSMGAADLMHRCDVVITCLPSPAASTAVLSK